MRPSYVIGFITDEANQNIILMLKQKPEHLKGKWNGVGGKIEGGEKPHQAMAREILEEIGLSVLVLPEQEFVFMRYTNKEWESSLHFFHIPLDRQTLLGARSMEKEEIAIFLIDSVLEDKRRHPLVSNLYWMLPYMRDKSRIGVAQVCEDDTPRGWKKEEIEP